jgi:hypothetical protein
MLSIYHDQPHHWTEDELATVGALATAGERRHPCRAGLRADGDLDGPAPVDQQLGARLSRLSTVDEIGKSIASELRQLSTTTTPGSIGSSARPHPEWRCSDRSASTSTRRPTSSG